ncbi:MFS transporter [Georgenia sp. 10Sc9-8]|uniref:MFS transporter n=1 Tax=Georgenia halotolerans TaxID=3028317 RepID=A0ABT5TZ89_9MICO|nr:MFS transporter [Georgenia halotolerans]
MHDGVDPRPIGVLLLSNLLGGIGVASGIAVGALLVAKVGGTAMAGLGQAASTLGAAVAAIPLAAMATRLGRRWSLATGYAIATVGAAVILTAAAVSQLLLLMVGLACFGVAQAANLQSRYAAADGTPAASRAKAMSIVVWATTVGSVAGPNLTAVGDAVGVAAGLPRLAGPYLFSLASFAAAGLVLALLYRPPQGAPEPTGRVARRAAPTRSAAPSGAAARASARAPGRAPGREPATGGVPAGPTQRAATDDERGSVADRVGTAQTDRAVGALSALRWAAGQPVPRFAVTLITGAHAVMVTVMVMTPLHMQHNGMSLQVVGVVISLHIVGMYALSPVFGWAADRYGAVPTAAFGVGALLAAVVLGFLAAMTGGGGVMTAVALLVLGVGWSAATISASALIAGTAEDAVRVPLQGATDAGMNYAGALAAALAGPLLAVGGFELINAAAALILLPVVLLLTALRRGPAAAHR